MRASPGPWQAVTKPDGRKVVLDRDGREVCEVSDWPSAGEANLRLIASAPELVDLLIVQYELYTHGCLQRTLEAIGRGLPEVFLEAQRARRHGVPAVFKYLNERRVSMIRQSLGIDLPGLGRQEVR